MMKGSSKPLVDQGDLIGSISVKSLTPFSAFVGIMKGAKGKKGQNLVNIGKVHEYGVTISVTDKMRGWFGAQGAHLKKSTRAIVIPKRAFIGPGIEDAKEIIAANYLKAGQKFWKLMLS